MSQPIAWLTSPAPDSMRKLSEVSRREAFAFHRLGRGERDELGELRAGTNYLSLLSLSLSEKVKDEQTPHHVH